MLSYCVFSRSFSTRDLLITISAFLNIQLFDFLIVFAVFRSISRTIFLFTLICRTFTVRRCFFVVFSWLLFPLSMCVILASNRNPPNQHRTHNNLATRRWFSNLISWRIKRLNQKKISLRYFVFDRVYVFCYLFIGDDKWLHAERRRIQFFRWWMRAHTTHISPRSLWRRSGKKLKISCANFTGSFY